MKTPRVSMRGRNPGYLSEDRVYAQSQVPPHASHSENLVLHWLDTIDQVDAIYLENANLERSDASYLDDPKLQRPPSEGSGVKYPPAQVPKLVNEKWPHLRPKQSPKFQRYRRNSDRLERILLQLNVESVRARKLRTSTKKRRPQSTKKRTRRSVLEDLFASRKAHTRTLDKNLLLDRGGVDEPQHLRYARLANLGIDKVDAQELTSFTGLLYLDLSENHVSMERLAVFPTLHKLNLQCNGISEVVIAEGSFVVLERLYAEENGLSAQSCVSQQAPEAGETIFAWEPCHKYSRAGHLLELISSLKLHVVSWAVKAISPLLQVLDLASNPIKDYSSLASLRKINCLRKVMLWDIPLATKVGYDLNGKCLPIARPILLTAMQAQREGQAWTLYKPITAGELPPLQSEEVLTHVVPKPKAFRPVVFPSEKMVKVSDKVCQRAEGQPQCTSDPAEEPVLGGSSSMSKPVIFAHTSPQLKKIQESKIPVNPNPKEPKAHVLSLKLALEMIPFRGVDEEIDPPSYRMPTRLNKIQEHTARLNLQAPVSARKRALFIARRFSNRAEREAKEQVQTMLEKLGQQLEDMKTRILDINDHHLNAPKPKFDYLTDEEAEP